MSRSLCDSSLQVYESHWARFVSFCRSKRWHVFRVRSHHFSTYMMHLLRDWLLPATIISHRTSVASVLRHWVYDPAADPHIKLLIRAFRMERPVQRWIMPKWTFILCFHLYWNRRSHQKAISSDDVIPLKWWTMKTASIGFGETVLISARFERLGRQVLERSHPTTTCGISFAGTWFPCEESTTVTGSGVDLHTGDSPSQPVRSGEDAVSCQTAKTLPTGLWNGCLFIGIATSRISWEVTSDDGSWRLSRKPTLKLIESMTELLHMRSEPCYGRTTVRWLYLTSCQLRFGGHLGSSRICIYATWPVSLMACLLWVQWWSHSKLWIQDIFTLLHSLHDLYAATAMTFLMKITWLLAGIFMYGME